MLMFYANYLLLKSLRYMSFEMKHVIPSNEKEMFK